MLDQVPPPLRSEGLLVGLHCSSREAAEARSPAPGAMPALWSAAAAGAVQLQCPRGPSLPAGRSWPHSCAHVAGSRIQLPRRGARTPAQAGAARASQSQSGTGDGAQEGSTGPRRMEVSTIATAAESAPPSGPASSVRLRSAPLGPSLGYPPWAPRHIISWSVALWSGGV